MTLFKLVIVLFFFCCLPLQAERLPYVELLPAEMKMVWADSIPTDKTSRSHSFILSSTKNKKVIAALLAFPLPFGIVGLHRIYLGCAPHVPVAYIATVGGGLGLLPLADFFVILFSKETAQFVNNGQVFMWLR